MKLRTKRIARPSTLIIGAMLVYGCGDDDDATKNETPDSGNEQTSSSDSGTNSDQDAGRTTTSSSSTGTSSSSSASSNREDAGVDAGEGGFADADTSEPPNADGGDAGDGTASPTSPEFAAVETVAAQVFTFANDLRALAFNPDGSKFFASGFVDVGTPSDRALVVARFNLDGTVDTDFGTDGYVVHNVVTRTVDDTVDPIVVLNAGDEQSLGLVALANGDLLVQANVTAESGVGIDVVLLKLNAAGERVMAFGTDGVARVDFGWTPADDANWPTEGAGPVDAAWDLKLDPSSTTEKVVVFGHGPPPPVVQPPPVDGEEVVQVEQRVDNDRWILKLLASDGSRDPEFTPYQFNTGGTFSDGARRGHVNADGSILSAGYTNYGVGLENHVVAIRLLANGVPDAAFGFGIGLPGVVRANPFIDDGGAAECYAFSQQSTGRYVTTGYGRATAAGVNSRLGWLTTDAVDIVSLGFSATGLESSYGVQGSLAIQSEQQPGFATSEDRGRDMVVLPDDRVVHVGRFGDFPAAIVTLPNGEPDLGSGTDGRIQYAPLVDPDTTRATPTSHLFKVALSPDGKYLATSSGNHPAGALVAVLRVGP